MILREFKEEDAQTIAGWLRSEEELYKWSADRINKYPISGEDIIENYAPYLGTGRFYPLTATDKTGRFSGISLSGIRGMTMILQFGSAL